MVAKEINIMTDLQVLIGNERVIWQGKPKFSVFILEAIFNPMLIFAIIWAAIDLTILKTMFTSDGGAPSFILVFFLVHLMPVWIYLGGIITAAIRYKNTEYVITERGIYITGGFISVNVQMKPFTDLSHVNIHKGLFDQMLGVGDVVMICNHTGVGYSSASYGSRHHGHTHQPFSIVDIADYQEVFQIIKNMQTDIYSDTMYPNAMRPDTNPGYNTRYDRDRFD